MREYIPDYQLEPPAWDDFIPVCPVCGEECDTVYLDVEGQIFGCDQCIEMFDAYEFLYDEEEEDC